LFKKLMPPVGGYVDVDTMVIGLQAAGEVMNPSEKRGYKWDERA
jgi:hypothetical protein